MISSTLPLNLLRSRGGRGGTLQSMQGGQGTLAASG